MLRCPSSPELSSSSSSSSSTIVPLKEECRGGSRIISRQRPRPRRRCCCSSSSCTNNKQKKKKKQKQKSSTSTSTSTSTTSTSSKRTKLEGGEWLPEDLQERVLARLPIPEVFRLRCVCKSWNRILRSPNFFALHSQAAPSETWSLMHSKGKGKGKEGSKWQAIFMFHPATGRWLVPPAPRLDDEPGFVWNLYAATGAGSLVCSPATHPDLGTYYFVLNILTASLRKLPRVPVHQPLCERDWAPLMSLDSLDKNRYRVFLVHLISSQVAMYDSTTQLWKLGKPTTPFLRRPKLTMLHGQLFATLITRNSRQFYVYDIHQDKWTDAQLPWPSCDIAPWASIRSFLLACGSGRTVLLVPDWSPAGTCHGFTVWDLQQEPNSGQKKWVEMARTPTAPQFATPEAELRRLSALFCSNRDFIIMTGADVTCTNFANPVLYDVSLGRWESLPPLPPKLAAMQSRYLSLMMLEPNLAATP